MAANDTASMALFCDFENIALGVRDAQYDKFDIRPVLERLLAKGSIVVKKAYCDWERYKGFKAAMHEANFELIEIPHVRQSGKNSADIRMVVDALDLCYTKSHVDTFVIISGDSDFSPLVSKLRENAKRVIGVGVKQSCSDLLVTNCDEFIYYDDLVRDREAGRGAQRREREKRSPEEEAKRSEKMEERKRKAMDIVSATFGDLMADRGEAERIWASVLKEVVKRRNPGFSESYYGFRTFGSLLEEAALRGLLAVGRDEKSGTYVTRAVAKVVEVAEGAEAAGEPEITASSPLPDGEPLAEVLAEAEAASAEDDKSTSSRRRGGRRTRKEGRDRATAKATEAAAMPAAVPAADLGDEAVVVAAPDTPIAPASDAAAAEEKPARRPRTRKKPVDTAVSAVEALVPPVPVAEPVETPAVASGEGAPAVSKAKRSTRPRKPRKTEAAAG
ncbi:MAG: NYN domain-containing protein [Azonexus sp.]|nr:NYN domain-containing protein [Azonexus sp.]